MIKEKFLNLGDEFKLDEDLVRSLAEEAERLKLKEEALRRITEAQEEPEEQQYIQRLDTKDLVKTDAEYAKCVAQQIPMRVVGYGHAIQILKEAEARQRNRIKKRKARKVTKAARKRNRR